MRDNREPTTIPEHSPHTFSFNLVTSCVYLAPGKPGSDTMGEVTHLSCVAKCLEVGNLKVASSFQLG